MELFDVTQKSLEVALHGTELRQQVVANNLANVNTPGFKRSDVEFGPALAEALQFSGTNSAVGGVSPVVKTDNHRPCGPTATTSTSTARPPTWRRRSSSTRP